MINKVGSKFARVFILDSGQLIAGSESVPVGQEELLDRMPVNAGYNGRFLVGQEQYTSYPGLLPTGYVVEDAIAKVGHTVPTGLTPLPPATALYLHLDGSVNSTPPLTGHIIQVGLVDATEIGFLFLPRYLYYNWGDL